MHFKRKWYLFFILFIFLVLPCAAFCDQESQSDQSNQDNSPATFPLIHIPEPKYEFQSVVEGQSVVHDFVIQNTGTKTLDITKVRPG
jgi:hypothetical protein